MKNEQECPQVLRTCIIIASLGACVEDIWVSVALNRFESLYLLVLQIQLNGSRGLT